MPVSLATCKTMLDGACSKHGFPFVFKIPSVRPDILELIGDAPSAAVRSLVMMKDDVYDASDTLVCLC